MKLNLKVIEVITESKSAKEPGRPLFNLMMQRLSRGEAEGIICWKLDRLARNPIDGGTIIWGIKQNGIKVITPAQSFAREEDNVILMYIEFGMAQKFVDDLSKNVRRGIDTKLQNGWYPGKAPQGYLNTTDRFTGKSTITKDSDRFDLIRRMWEIMLSGMKTPAQILATASGEWGLRTRPMRTKGDRPFAKSAIYKIFTNPFYYGWFEYPKASGQWYKGKHDPMVSEAEYDRVQKLLGKLGNPRPRMPDLFPFRGLLCCGECGGAVTAEQKFQVICERCQLKFAYRQRDSCPGCGALIKRMGHARFLHYSYYHCTKRTHPECSQRSIAAEFLETQIESFLGSIDLAPAFKAWAIKHLHELADTERAFHEKNVKSQQKAYDEFCRRIENLLRLKTSPKNADDSLLSDEEYGRQRTELIKQRDLLARVLADPSQEIRFCLHQSVSVFDLAFDVRERFRKSDSRAKKEILLATCSNLALTDGKLSIEAKKPFVILGDVVRGPVSRLSAFEPENNGVVEPVQSTIQPSNSPRRALGDDVRTWQRKMERAATLIYAHFKNEMLAHFRKK